jgi:hypothetical protein
MRILQACLPLLVLFISVNLLYATEPILHWKFDTPETQNVENDKIIGNTWIVDGVKGKALKFDGISSYLTINQEHVPKLGDAFTIHAWIALGAYPWNWCSIYEQRENEKAGFLFGIDDRGHVGLYLSVNNKWIEITSDVQLEIGRWYFVAAAFEPGKGVSLFINAEQIQQENLSGAFNPTNNAPVFVGRNSQKLTQSNGVRQDSHQLANILFDGVMDELAVYDQALSIQEIQQKGSQSAPRSVTALPKRV